MIHQDEGVSESLACDTTLIHYDPLSQAAADLRACGDWLLSAIDTIASLAEERRMSTTDATTGEAPSRLERFVDARLWGSRALTILVTIFAIVALYFVVTVPLAFGQQLAFATHLLPVRAGVSPPARASTRRS